MEKKETGNIKKIIVGAIITLFVGGTSPWWWNKYIDPPPVIQKPIKVQGIYKKGNKNIKIEGVNITPPAKNMSDTFIYKSIDLDSGNITNNLDSDLEIIINVHKLLITLQLKEGVEIGKNETSYIDCKSLLKNNNEKNINTKLLNTPTSYFCTETNNGRISQFRITSLKKYKTPGNNRYSIIINLKYTTWHL